MNAHDFLKQQHRMVEAAYEDFKLATDEQKEEIGKKILTDLTVHTEIEEEIYYPEIERVGETRLLEESISEHQAAKTLIAKLAAIGTVNEEYEATMKALMEAIRHHIKEEESEIMPQMEQMLSAQILASLGTQLAERSKELQESTLKRMWAAVT